MSRVSHQRTASAGGETGTGPGSTNAAAGSSGGGYRSKAITRELLISVCRKHFALKTVAGGGGSGASGRSFKGQSQLAKMEYAGQHGEGYDYGSSEAQTKLETLERYLKRATHLQLDGLKLTHTFPVGETAAAAAAAAGQAAQAHVPDHAFGLARNIRVLYLHENHLSTLDDFSFCAATLSHLYLQNNRIARMENLVQLTNLEKLYIGNNEIRVLEGFAPEGAAAEEQQQPSHDDPTHSSGVSSRPSAPPPPPFYLVELHMDSQTLPAGLGLQLSIPSMQALSSSLTVLSLSSNQMDSDSILPISLLARLTDLNLAQNRIDDLKVVAEMVSYLSDLRALDLRSNPVNSGPGHTAVTHKKYRDRVIMSSQRISVLDGKDVLDNQREYLHGLMEQRRIKRAAAAAASGAPRELSEEERKFAALHAPPTFPYAPKVLTLRTAGSGSGSGGGSISVGQLGGMGAGSRHTLHGSASSAAFGGGGGGGAAYQAHSGQYQQSPFLDYDENVGGSGGDPCDPHPSHEQPQAGGDSSSEGTASSMTFTGDPTRLNDLLQQRGLVSAFTTMAIHSGSAAAAAAAAAPPPATVADSARARRASMNSLNQAPNGWDGGRTQHALPPTLSRKTSQTSTSSSSASASSSSATPSRSSTRVVASKPASSK